MLFTAQPPQLPQPPAEVSNPSRFSASSLSVQDLAQMALAIKSGRTSNVDISQFENSAFKSYLRDTKVALMVCKGCHGG